ncbi:acyl-CoA N-acyltransferase [Mrakia frigida]|uniref:GNAT family N-acetyltransferase n=1 Tax=Mrakia frigida TaxID=29902 RepID=UPI003FCBF2E8
MAELSPQEVVKVANKITPAELASDLQLLEGDAKKFDLTVRRAPYTPAEKTSIFSIFSSNMKSFYVDSSFGWKPLVKKAELFHSQARYIVARRSPSSFSGEVAGYLGWRFVVDETVEGGEDAVVYLYELSISPKHQKMGLGRILVEGVEELGRKAGMKKVVLTSLKKNLGAVAFYSRMGYEIDPTSPSRSEPDEDQNEFDYEILSKTL